MARRAVGRSRRSRPWIGALAILLTLAGGTMYVVGAPGRPGDRAVDARFVVDPGTVPVVTPGWVAPEAGAGVLLPAASVARFTAGVPQPVEGDGTVETFVQVLHYRERATIAWRRANPGRLPASGKALRYAVEVRPVRAEPGPGDALAVTGVAPHELVVAHYLYSLGSNDIVTGDLLPARATGLVLPTPSVPVAVEFGRGAPSVRLLAPQPGWRATLTPVAGGAPVSLAPDADGATLSLALGDLLDADTRRMLQLEDRPDRNLGWLRAWDATGTLQVDLPVRG